MKLTWICGAVGALAMVAACGDDTGGGTPGSGGSGGSTTTTSTTSPTTSTTTSTGDTTTTTTSTGDTTSSTSTGEGGTAQTGSVTTGPGGGGGGGQGGSEPGEWLCPEAWLSDADCDCGCGAIDPACAANDVSLCDLCWEASMDGFGCNADPLDESCPGNIDPNNIAVCLSPE